MSVTGREEIRTAALLAITAGPEDRYGYPPPSFVTLPATGDGVFSSRWSPRVFERAGNTVPAINGRHVFSGTRDSGVFSCPLYGTSDAALLTYERLFDSCGLVREGPGNRWVVTRRGTRSQSLRLYLDDLVHEITGAYGSVSFAADRAGGVVSVAFRLQGRHNRRLSGQSLPQALDPGSAIHLCNAQFSIDPDDHAPISPQYLGFDIPIAAQIQDITPNRRDARIRYKAVDAFSTWSVSVEEMGYDFMQAYVAGTKFALEQDLSGWHFSCPNGRVWTLAVPPSYAKTSAGITAVNLTFGINDRRRNRLEVRRT